MRGWRVPLRIARRDALRSRGRTILMLVMIALPVLGVTAADVLIQTQDVNTVESLDRRLGTEAAAKVYASGAPVAPQEQGRDPERGGNGPTVEKELPAPTLATVLATLGGGRTGIAVAESYPQVRTAKGLLEVGGTELDLGSPLSSGLFDLREGRWPQQPDEVVVNRELSDRGAALGSEITVQPGGPENAREPGGDVTRTVVGIAESTSVRDWGQLVGLPGSLGTSARAEQYWLVGGPPVTWDDVGKLNAIGALAVSREVMLHPGEAALAADAALDFDSALDPAVVTMVILIVVMALIEVVLLAGPAFAVGARRQARPLALLAANGGTPRQARRVVLATGVVIGLAGSVAGVLLGIAVARAGAPVLQRFNGSWFGPFEVPWLHLLGVAFFGFVSALLAAVVPAWIASRADVVAVLAGRRGDRKPSARSPFVGVALLGGGVGLAVLGSRTVSSSGGIFIAGSAILCVFGMLFLVPVVVVGAARLSRRLPLPLRFAVRDAARHRTRTTPAVAAVAATVAGVVALGIGVTSDEKGNRETYVSSLTMGAASISADGEEQTDPVWAGYTRILRKEVPGVGAEPVLGIPYTNADGASQSVWFATPAGDAIELSEYGSSVGTQEYVYDEELPGFIRSLKGLDATAAEKVLDAGGVVVFADRADSASRAVIQVETYPVDAGDVEPEVTKTTVPALIVDLADRAPVAGIVPVGLATRLGLAPTTVGLLTDGTPISEAQEKNISEALNATTPHGSLYVERGYQATSETRIIQLILAALGAVLMLGGTLTATFLALSDARPDLATLSAVGAEPRTRRAVAAGYALAVGGIGAVLGVLVGFVPGIAITYPLTSQTWKTCTDDACAALPDHFLEVPWLLILSLVVLLPLLVAGVVWVSARSRLPMVARLG